FTDHGAYDGRTQTGHHRQVLSNSFGDTALFRVNAGISTGGINQGKHRQLETLSHLHQTQCFTITFRLRHTEVAVDLVMHGTTFLFTNHHDRFAIQTCDAADDGFVVTKMAITMQFIPIGKHAADVIRGIRTLRMAGNLDDVPGGQVGVNTFGQLGAFFAELGDLVRNIKVVGIANQLQLFDLAFKDRNRLFKIQIIQIHITNWLKVWDVALVIYSGATSDGLPGIAGTIRSPKIR